MADGPSVVGYYTLSALSIERGTIPEPVVKKLKLPSYPLLPATLMGRLAVDQKHQKRGIGEFLLMDGLQRSDTNSRQPEKQAPAVAPVQTSRKHQNEW
jgi:hypothetical protein